MVEKAVGISKSIMKKAREDRREYLVGLMEYMNTPISDRCKVDGGDAFHPKKYCLRVSPKNVSPPPLLNKRGLYTVANVVSAPFDYIGDQKRMVLLPEEVGEKDFLESRSPTFRIDSSTKGHARGPVLRVPTGGRRQKSALDIRLFIRMSVNKLYIFISLSWL
ncbi:hypothetical protein TNCV_2718111 [Trichonephila clavipes]|nr:hypothetical protein TNCV_2718111 [Trichonephila clavipes]